MLTAAQLLELARLLEVFQPGIGDLGAVQLEVSQLGQGFQLSQPTIGNLRVGQVQACQVGNT